MATGTATPNAFGPNRVPGGSSLPKENQESFIDGQLRKTRAHVKMVDIAGGMMLLLAGSLVFWLVTALVDHWVVSGGLSFWGRTLFLVAYLGGASFYFATRILPLLIKRINPLYAAQTIERAQPTLKNSVLNFLFFRSHREGVPDGVYQAMQTQAAVGLHRAPIDTAVDRTRLIKLGYVLIGVLAVCCAYKIFSPKDPFQTVGRVVMPWADLLPSARVTIEDIQPGDATAYRGQQVKISAQIHGLGNDEPVTLNFTTADGQNVERPVAMHVPKDGFRHECLLPGGESGLQADAEYWIAAGDAVSNHFHLDAINTPQIEIERLDFDYPDYMGKDFGHRSVEKQGDIKEYEGTRVTIHAVANHPIKQAYIDWDCDNTDDVKMKIDGQKATATFKLAFRKDDRQTPEHASYQLRFVTDAGYRNPEPVRHKIEVLPDLPPEISILAPKADELVVPLNGRETFKIRAADPDFKPQSVRVIAKDQDGKEVLSKDLLLEPLSGQFLGDYEFVPQKLGLKDKDVIDVYAVAIDNKTPDANRTETALPHKTITIVAPDPRQNQQQNPPPNQPQPKQDKQPNKDPNQQQNKDPNQQKNPQDKGGGKPDKPEKGNQGGDKGDPMQGGDDKGQPNPNDKGNENPNDPKQNDAGQEKKDGKGSDGKDGMGEKDPSKGDGQDKPPKGGAGGEGASNPSDQPQEGSPKDGKNPKGGNSSGKGGGQDSPKGGQPGDEAAKRPVSPNGEEDDKVMKAFQENERSKQDDKPNSKSSDPKDKTDSPTDKGTQPNQGGGSGSPSDKKDADPKAPTQNGPGQSGPDQKGTDSKAGDTQGPTQNDSANSSGGKKTDSPPDPKSAGVKRDPGDKGGEQGTPGQAAPKQGDSPKQKTDKGEGTTGQPEKTNGPKDGKQNDAPNQDHPPGGDPSKSGEQGHDPSQTDPKSPDGAKPGTENSDTPNQFNDPKKDDPSKGTQTDKPTGDKGETAPQSGDPSKGQADSKTSNGSPEPQADGKGTKKPEEKTPKDPKPGEGDNDAESPSVSPKESNAKSDTPGDRSGAGDKGGGQPSKQPMGQQPGTTSAADKGNAGSQEAHGTDDSTQKGTDKKSEKPTGQPGTQKGKGGTPGQGGDKSDASDKKDDKSDKSSDNSGGQGDPSDKQGKKQSDPKDGGGNEQPGGGNPTANAKRQNVPPGAEPGDDPANQEYAKKATDLVLEKLKKQMAKGDVDQELLDKLGWTRADMDAFVKRWEKMKADANLPGRDGEKAKEQLNESIRSLGLRKDSTNSGPSNRDDAQRGFRDAPRTAPPPEYQDQFRKFNQGK